MFGRSKQENSMHIVQNADDYYVINKPANTTDEQDNILQVLKLALELQKENQQLSDRIEHLETWNKMDCLLSHYNVSKKPVGNGSMYSAVSSNNRLIRVFSEDTDATMKELQDIDFIINNLDVFPEMAKKYGLTTENKPQED